MKTKIIISIFSLLVMGGCSAFPNAPSPVDPVASILDEYYSVFDEIKQEDEGEIQTNLNLDCEDFSETEIARYEQQVISLIKAEIPSPEIDGNGAEIWLNLVEIDSALSSYYFSQAVAMENTNENECHRSIFQKIFTDTLLEIRSLSLAQLKIQMRNAEFWEKLDSRDVRRAFFYTVQHADEDPEFQLQMLGELTLLGESHPQHQGQFPALVDRLLVSRTGFQRYGTILTCDTETNQGMLAHPLENPDEVDRLRAQFNLAELKKTYDAVCEFARTGQETVVRDGE